MLAGFPSLFVLSSLMLLDPAPVVEEQEKADRALVQKAGLDSDGPGVLKFLRRHALTAEETGEIEKLVKQLGSEEFDEREKATMLLIARGWPAVRFLNRVRNDKDLEVTLRAGRCLLAIQKDYNPSLTGAALRLLTRNPTPGGTAVLLLYAPSVETADHAPFLTALIAAAQAHPDEARSILLRAARDSDAERRRAAAYVLGRSSDDTLQAAGRGLLDDKDPLTRYRAVQGLLAGRDRQAVATLIDLLNGPDEIASLAEDLLLTMVGDNWPLDDALFASNDRRKQREAWLAWWRDNGAKVDLAQMANRPPYLGFTIVTQADKVIEVDREGKRRSAITINGKPTDAQPLPGRRMLIADENNTNPRIIECDPRGKVIWELKLPALPLSCKRLPDGNTFVVTHQAFGLYTRAGRTIYSLNVVDILKIGRIESAVLMRNGHVAVVANKRFNEVDPTNGQIIRAMDLPHMAPCWSIEELADGHFLLVSFRYGRTVEIDGTGQVVSTFDCPGAFHATRLPNGNTLVTCHKEGKIVEVTPEAKIVNEIKVDGPILRSAQH